MPSTYKKLFGIRVAHTFYTDKASPDFVLEPTELCKRIVSGHRLLVRRNAVGLDVHYPKSASAVPAIGFDEAVNFQFTLRLTNPFLPNFTELPRKNRGTIYLYSRQAQQTVLEQGEAVVTRGELPPLKIPGEAKWVRIGLSNSEGRELDSETVPVESGWASPTMSLRRYSEGLYKLSASTEFERWVFRPNSIGGDWFGLVDLRFGAGELPFADDPPIFEIQFTPRSAQWTYRVVMDNPDETVEYRIVQFDETSWGIDEDNHSQGGDGENKGKKGGSGPHAPERPPPELIFSKPKVKELGDGKTLFKFVTVIESPDDTKPALIPYREEPRKYIALVSYTDPSNGHGAGAVSGPKPILENLPNPSPNHYEPTVTVHV